MALTYQQAIDGGTVSVEDGTKSAEEYAPARKVRVELSFTTSEGGQDNADELLSQVADLASAEVARLLGGKAPAVSAPAGEASAPATTRTRRTKAQIAADEAAARETAGQTNTASSGGAPATSADGAPQTSADDFDPTADIQPETPATDDGLDLSEFDVTPEPEPEAEAITDADLNSAVQKKNAELADPPRIRELIGSYNPDPKSVFQLRQIPADKRAEFLKKLAALKKA